MDVEYALYYSTRNLQQLYCVNKIIGNPFPRVESLIHEMKIESTAVEMFWKEKQTVFCAFIANICPEKRKNNLELKKQLIGKSFQGEK